MARDLYFDNGNDRMTYEEMTFIMEAEYYSPARQAALKEEVERLRLPTSVNENKISSILEGITRIVDRIN